MYFAFKILLGETVGKTRERSFCLALLNKKVDNSTK